MRRSPMNTTLTATGMVAILRLTDGRRFAGIIDTLVSAGVRCLEVTLTTEGALGLVEEAVRRVPEGVEVGVGSVTSGSETVAAIASGARFVVSPNVDMDVVQVALAARIPVYPGALTPTEIIKAWRAGASAVKLFPAELLGPGYVHQVRAPLPEIPLIPTGGVGEGNLGAYLRSGSAAVGVGGSLIGDAERDGSLTELGDRARRYLRLISQHRRADG